MATAMDSYASFVSASFFPSEVGRVLAALDGSDTALSTREFWDMEEEIVDLAAEMVPTFFESGQLMWEISTHTEGTNEKPCQSKPEIVLTDGSYLSVNVVQGDLVRREDFEKMQGEALKPTVLSGDHCFELLTDEDRPLDTGADCPVLMEEQEVHLEVAAGYPPIDEIPIDLTIGDCEWMQQQRMGYEHRRQRKKDVHEVEESLRRFIPIKEQSHQSKPKMADSASEMCASGDFIREDDPTSRFSSPEFDGRTPSEEISELDASLTIHKERSLRPKQRKGLLKNAFSNAVSKVNEVLHVYHSKKKRPDKTPLKFQSNLKESPFHLSPSACDVYRRRNTFICQKMEGMINSKPGSVRQLKPPQFHETIDRSCLMGSSLKMQLV